MSYSLVPRIVPIALDSDAAAVGLERCRERLADLTDSTEADRAAGMLDDASCRSLIEGIAAHSPYLTREIVRELAFTGAIFADGVDAAMQRIWTDLEAVDPRGDTAQTMKSLRIAKRRAALTIALADIAGLWNLIEVTGAISEIAERTLAVSWRHALSEAIRRKKLPLDPEGDLIDGSGLVCLAMGKLGARELNYSSDIDLIVLFDDTLPVYADHWELRHAFVQATQTMVKLMEERTADGYVFRTDLRLRPDPSSTPPAISLTAAETYYESMGQNWERAAMIKARAVASDGPSAAAFASAMTPFIWRRHLDFAAIQDVHSIKRQIAVHRKAAVVKAEGQNVKLGRGGIREIEFFAQTQQLIWGGRDARLRVRGTEDALKALVEAGRVREEVASDLKLSYRFLRKVEHRLQMIEDKQTQELPQDPAALDRFAAFLGYEDPKGFRGDLAHHLHTVAYHYGRLFEEAPALSVPTREAGSLVFTGSEDDPDTLKTLKQLGFTDPSAVAETVRNWHRGRTRATRSERARQILTEITPALLEAVGRMPQPDQAFRRLDRFLDALPSGVQIFSLFHANPNLIQVVAEILGMAPSLAGQLGREPALFEGILTHDVMQPLPDAETLTQELERHLDATDDYELALDVTRRWTGDRRFQIGVQIIRSHLDADRAGTTYSDVADATINALLPWVERDFARRHGRLPDVEQPALAVIALGKYGGRELSYGSDLDLVFLYDAPLDLESDGDKPLYTSAYMIRLGQRLISALSAKTAEGALYEVDMRLRPTGNKGPVAISMEAFQKYHDEDAWTWERMALTRARVVAAPAGFKARIEESIRGILTQERDAKTLAGEVADMRERTAKEHKADSPWTVKHWRGGLLDLEFIAQFLQLRHGHEHPDVLDGNTANAFLKLGAAGILPEDEAAFLSNSVHIWRNIQGLLRLTVGNEFDPETAPEALKGRLAKTSRAIDFNTLERVIEKMSAVVMRTYDRYVVGAR
ncbi:bifunctional [glutamine synthetase] adenylyltransferase/[glutamine synthetase]-adenylyl-L-tyrosine phosphorylase [Thalassobaculum sp. OXR-137]|uniref:bifunctional [glutamine synthetase] adenylyltransferase/[glutamine synthetase]-adenylyl-L-tyrosine phosphorylase n=1 Tax=Thalassobaculum sp. OXR-137 TaxID=3100173 RepID=UPI002AC8CD60|nr:bifunctional [glutamine synthetase] adenylyltransferase/[glutamine synthetase]-adenylyl-L-tyrosine phosphorylase [Thalassobaculum sp. OXR-137]WPZ36976.1 bifunctional [glutamine synthetase] adenylyltransferase/[glutamine synthetase]-adenylyl-L-tyrosine phosphorylase [Thalassobaculum sp. OXR-137]